MRKKLVVLATSCVLAFGVITGCSSKEAAPEVTTAVETTVTDSSDAETTPEQADAESESNDADTAADALTPADSEYLSMTGAEWNEASDEEKETVAKAYLIDTTKATATAAGQEFTSEMEEAITDEDIAATVESLNTAFASDDTLTMQDMLDASIETVNAMMEAVESVADESVAEDADSESTESEGEENKAE